MAEVRPIDANAMVAAIIEINGCDYGSMFDFNAHTAANEALKDVVRLIDDAPLLDYAPVRHHGEWIERKEIFDDEQEPVDAIGCSQCGKSQRVFRRTPYCPNCGVKMDGGESQ